MPELIILILLVTIIFLAYKCAALYISLLSLFIWLEKKVYKQPTREEMNECKEILVSQLFERKKYGHFWRHR